MIVFNLWLALYSLFVFSNWKFRKKCVVCSNNGVDMFSAFLEDCVECYVKGNLIVTKNKVEKWCESTLWRVLVNQTNLLAITIRERYSVSTQN